MILQSWNLDVCRTKNWPKFRKMLKQKVLCEKCLKMMSQQRFNHHKKDCKGILPE